MYLADDIMSLIYRWNNKEFRLEYFIKHFHFEDIWGEIIKKEYDFWCPKITLDDLIIEASEEFEEIMWEKRWYIEFIHNDKNKMDYNLLLNALR